MDIERKVSFLCQKAEIPDISLGQANIPTAGFAQIPISGSIQYCQLNLEFIVDEDLRNYMEIHNWIRALGTPSVRQERKDWNDRWGNDSRSSTDDTKVSDATLQVLNNNNIVNFDIVFQSLWPVSLATIPYDVTGTDNDYLSSTVTFNYTSYEY